MSSPFPGMNPYLQATKLWPAFHGQFVACLYQTLLPGLVDRYRARVASRSYHTEMPLFTSISREEHVEEFLEIRNRTDTTLVAQIDLVSPTNKSTDPGKAAYAQRRRDVLSQRAHHVEIDLVLGAEHPIGHLPEGLPEWDHLVKVTRAGQSDKHEIYSCLLKNRLPKIRLPLGKDERDTVIDLQAIFNRTFDQGPFASLIDYRSAPSATLTAEQAQWVDALCRCEKKR